MKRSIGCAVFILSTLICNFQQKALADDIRIGTAGRWHVDFDSDNVGCVTYKASGDDSIAIGISAERTWLALVHLGWHLPGSPTNMVLKASRDGYGR